VSSKANKRQNRAARVAPTTRSPSRRGVLRVRQSGRAVIGTVKSAYGVAGDEASFTLDSPAAVAGLAWDAKDAALRSNREVSRDTQPQNATPQS
jgi:hypothetical protein